jgi:hypothetical protein
MFVGLRGSAVLRLWNSSVPACDVRCLVPSADDPAVMGLLHRASTYIAYIAYAAGLLMSFAL